MRFMTLLQKPLSGLFTTLENGTFIGFLNNCFFKKRLFAGTPFIILIFFLSACTSTQRKTPNEKTIYLGFLSQFLSGESVESNSPYYSISQTAYFKKYSMDMKKIWDTIEKESYGPIRNWESINLKDKSYKIQESFYPFSGADFVNLYGFYPNAKKYIMIALEKSGKVTNPLDLSPEQIRKSLHSIKTLISEISERNYFRRKIMREEFRNPHFSGTLPALIIFITKVGLEIEDITDVIINNEGSIAPKSENLSKNPEGVRIQFYDPKTNSSKELIYLSIMLNKDSHSAATTEGKFLSKLNNFGVMIKSAEYLFPRVNLDGLRDIILQKSQTIIQDDSGIPFTFFKEDNWNIQLFGNYKKATLLANIPYQPVQSTLKEKYLKNSTPLNFSYGYGILRGKNESNLMLLFKK